MSSDDNIWITIPGGRRFAAETPENITGPAVMWERDKKYPFEGHRVLRGFPLWPIASYARCDNGLQDQRGEIRGWWPDALRWNCADWAEFDSITAQRRRFDALEKVISMVSTLREITRRGGPGSRRDAEQICDEIEAQICDIQNQ